VRVTGQHRSTHRRTLRPAGAPEAELRRRLRQIASEWPRYGHRRAHALLRHEVYKVNRKRVQRIWRAEGLRVPAHPPKRRRLGKSTVPAARLVAEGLNHVWAMDFLFDVTTDGHPFKVLAMCDEFSRESIGGALGRSMTAEDVVRILDQAVTRRGVPAFIRCDNGPEFTAAVIRDWCRFSGAGSSFIEPGVLGRTRG
jgi:putative transposase